jgi:hypothetical protein
MFHKNLTAAVLRKTTNGVVVALKLKAQDYTMTAMEIINYLDGKKGFNNTKFEFTDTGEIPISRSESLTFELDDTNTLNATRSIDLTDSEISLDDMEVLNLDAMENELAWN